LSLGSWWQSTELELRDDLWPAALSLVPELGELRRWAEGAIPEGKVGMTGSGPTLIMVLPANTVDAQGIARRLEATRPHDVDILLTRTVGASEYQTSRFEGDGLETGGVS
jgi:4-diphosphocytidyl-2C-methyl-D-erythritol kinase